MIWTKIRRQPFIGQFDPVAFDTREGDFQRVALGLYGMDADGLARLDRRRHDRFRGEVEGTGLVTLTFRSLNSFMRPVIRKPRGFCHPAMCADGADCRTH